MNSDLRAWEVYAVGALVVMSIAPENTWAVRGLIALAAYRWFLRSSQ